MLGLLALAGVAPATEVTVGIQAAGLVNGPNHELDHPDSAVEFEGHGGTVGLRGRAAAASSPCHGQTYHMGRPPEPTTPEPLLALCSICGWSSTAGAVHESRCGVARRAVSPQRRTPPRHEAWAAF